MPRPRKCRTVREDAPVRFFKPQGVPMRDLRGVVLPLDGLEALRLADAEGLEHAAAAELMDISRPTFSRLLAEARTIVATALVRGWAIRIDGGTVVMDDEPLPGCGRRRRGHCNESGGAVAAREMTEHQPQEDGNAQS